MNESTVKPIVVGLGILGVCGAAGPTIQQVVTAGSEAGKWRTSQESEWARPRALAPDQDDARREHGVAVSVQVEQASSATPTGTKASIADTLGTVPVGPRRYRPSHHPPPRVPLHCRLIPVC